MSTLFDIRFMRSSGDWQHRMTRDQLELLMQHRPVIEIDGNMYDIELVSYEPEEQVFYIHLIDR